MARGRLVLDLARDRCVLGDVPASLPVHELRTEPGEPRTRWCAIGDSGAPGGADRSEAPTSPPSDLPLLVVTDGEAHLERLDTPGMLAAAVRTGDLPPLLAVFLDAWPERARDLGVPGGQAAWIADTLVPRLRPAPDPRRTVVTGSSFGGLTALFALARAPHRIGAAIAQSVSLWRYPHLALADPLRAAISGAAPEEVRIRLHAGHFEGTMGESARELADVVSTATGAEIPVHLHRGGHDWAWWQPAMIEELSELLAPESSRERPARPRSAPNYHGRSSVSPEEGVP
jgi:enterochelin esterase family protein